MLRRLWLVCILLLAASPLLRADRIKDRPFSIRLETGGAQPALNDSAQVWLFSPSYGARLQYMINDRVGIALSGHYTRIYNDSLNASLLKFNHDRATQRWQIVSLGLGPRVYLRDRAGAAPFVSASVNWLIWNVKNERSGLLTLVPDGGGGSKELKANELGVTVGVGCEWILRQRFSLDVGMDVTYLTGIGADFVTAVNESRSRALLSFRLGLAINVGARGRDLRSELSDSEPQSTRTRRVIELDSPDSSRLTPAVDSAATVGISISVAADTVDSDLDGVPDRGDLCGNTPSGARVDSLGCPIDSDGDGIPDGIDRCDNTPVEAHLSLDEFGCPSDRDYDQVPDYRDSCPNSPPNVAVDSLGCSRDSDRDGVSDESDNCATSPPGYAVDQRGCPELAKIFAKRVFHTLFREGETKLTAAGKQRLDSVFVDLRVFPAVTATIAGYTDDLGPEDANQIVSEKRAEAVRAYLIDRGIRARRLTAIGKGEVDFVASNRTKTGREQNRRIEIEFKY